MVLTLRIYPTNYRNGGVCKSGIYAQNEWFSYIIISLFIASFVVVFEGA